MLLEWWSNLSERREWGNVARLPPWLLLSAAAEEERTSLGTNFFLLSFT